MSVVEKKELACGGERIQVSLVKIQDLARAMQIMSRAARCENLLFSANRGLEIFVTEPNRKFLLYLHCHPDFFEFYRVPEPIEVGLLLSEFAKGLHDASQVNHIKLLEMRDTVHGQLSLKGHNPNGISDALDISPQEVDTIYEFDFTKVPLMYPFVLDVPSKLFHGQLTKHQKAKVITLEFDATKRQLFFKSEKQHGLISESKTCLDLHPENIIVPPSSSSSSSSLTSQMIYIDTKYLRIMSRLYKLAHVIRVYMSTGKEAIFEYILKQSPVNPNENSAVHLRLGRTSCERHPYVQ